VRGVVASDHIVQFFDTTASLAATVTTFLADGYRQGETLLAVARPSHWEAIARGLRAQRCPVTTAIASGRLTKLDADETLAEFMRNGLPDSLQFHAIVGSLIRRLSRGRGRLRIYGEMVEVLAEEGNFYAARRLEELWNELAVRHSFTLLCGYSAAHFASPGARESLAQICDTHTQVQKGAADPLANFLLAREA